MGCDIHGFCEVKENGVWKVNTKKVFMNGYYISDEELEKRRENRPDYTRLDFQKNEFNAHPDDGRSYDWFAILADVRNGRGFAGTITGDGFNIIAEPRGVPEDATSKWKKQVKEWEGDMHSHSYLYLKDFDNFDWSQTTQKQGVISLEQYKELRGTNNCPEIWSGGVGGPGLVTVDMDSADKILSGETVVVENRNWVGDLENVIHVNLESGHGIHVLYTWDVLYSEWFDYKIKGVIEPLRKLKEKYEDVRYVFGFDN